MDLVGIRLDADLPDAAGLIADLGAGATERLLARSGWQVSSSRATQLIYRPGRALIIRRAVRATRGDEVRAFTVAHEALNRPIGAGPAGSGNGVVRVPVVHRSTRSRSWVFPFDPYLADLPRVLSIEGARRLAEPLTGFSCSVRSSVVRYRPGRRTVVRLEVRRRGRTDEEPRVFYLKISAPERAERMVANATMLGSFDRRFVVPVARSGPGVVAFPAAPGRTLRAVLTSPDDPTPVRIDELIGVASSVATVPIHGLRPKSSPRRRLRRAVRTLAAVTPHLDRRLQRLSEGIESALDGSRRTDAAVHGDLYEGQVLVDARGSITAVLDTDGLGIGDPVMDAANVAAHLGALTETHPHLSLRLGRVREAAIAAIADTFDTAPAMVAAREAIAGLQLAAGPLRVMDPNWIERTERRIEWVEHAFGLRDAHRQRVL